MVSKGDTRSLDYSSYGTSVHSRTFAAGTQTRLSRLLALNRPNPKLLSIQPQNLSNRIDLNPTLSKPQTYSGGSGDFAITFRRIGVNHMGPASGVVSRLLYVLIDM